MKKSEADGLTMQERAECLLRVSLKDPEHLKRWLQESGRRYLVFDSVELVDSLPFPEGVDTLMQLVACYRDHRVAIPSGEYEMQGEVKVPLCKGEVLEVFELDRVIRDLIRQITERDPTWDVNNRPL